MVALNLTAKDFEEIVLKNKKPVMVDFWAAWCGPCRMAGPVIDELALEYKDRAVIAKVDVDAQPELAQKFNIMSIPVVILFKDGKEIDRQIGFPGKQGYQAMIEKIIK